MKEIRLHGRGGQGVVKASQLVVKAAVAGGSYGQFIPFFGVERKGSPVFGYLRLSDTPIRRKMQIYDPDILVIMDDSLFLVTEHHSLIKKLLFLMRHIWYQKAEKDMQALDLHS